MSVSLKTSSKQIKPEKRVEQAIMFWCHQNGWSVDVYESKASYSARKKCYVKNPGIPEGHPDISGSDHQGLSIYIEMKAPGHEKKIRMGQYIFLNRKIDANCFAIVTSSPSHLSTVYSKWLSLRLDPTEARYYLRSQLPKNFLSKSGLVFTATQLLE